MGWPQKEHPLRLPNHSLLGCQGRGEGFALLPHLRSEGLLAEAAVDITKPKPANAALPGGQKAACRQGKAPPSLIQVVAGQQVRTDIFVQLPATHGRDSQAPPQSLRGEGCQGPSAA